LSLSYFILKKYQLNSVGSLKKMMQRLILFKI
jgi:hypothetical protein